MKIKSLIAATALALSSAGAFAVAPISSTTYSLGALVAGDDILFIHEVAGKLTSFQDFLTFSVPVNGGAEFNVMSVGLSTKKVSLSGVSLYSDTDGIANNGIGEVWVTGVGSGSSLTFATAALAAGNYYLSVAGITAGSNGGAYTGGISVTAVPEPETFAMMLAGLGLMGSIAMRRNKKNNA